MGNEIELLVDEMEANRSLLAALGDEVRQHLILTMLSSKNVENGLRVGDIASGANLSRPAVSHHLQILKEVGVVDVRHEGTRNYYFFTRNPALYDRLIEIIRLTKICTTRKGR